MPKKSPPAHVYKYQPVNTRTLSNLKQASIWFSAPADFNDPFDCALRGIDPEQAALDHETHQALRADQHLAPVPALRRLRAGVRVGQCDAPDTMGAGLRDEVLPRALGGQSGDHEVIGALDDLERLRADRARGAQNEDAACHAQESGRVGLSAG